MSEQSAPQNDSASAHTVEENESSEDIEAQDVSDFEESTQIDAEDSESSSGLIADPRLSGEVLVSDWIPGRQRRLEDLLEAIASFVGIVIVLVLGVLLQSTTQGVEADVRAVLAAMVRSILFLPFSVLEGVFVFVVPVVVIVHLARRSEFAAIIHTILTVIAAALIAWGLLLLTPHLPDLIREPLTLTTATGSMHVINYVLMVLAAMLTVAGTVSTSPAIRYPWWGIWILLLLSLVRGVTTLQGLLLTILLGRLFGTIARSIVGFTDGRAGPTDLVAACLDISITPARIIRCDLDTLDKPLETWRITEGSGDPDFRRGVIHPPLVLSSIDGPTENIEVTPQFSDDSDRSYQIVQSHGLKLDMRVLDPVTGIIAMIVDVWNNVRLRGISRWVTPSIKANAERVMLSAATAATAGVRTPQPVGLSEAGSSVAVFWEPLPPVMPLRALEGAGFQVDEDVLDQAWIQLRGAHSRGVCHRDLDLNALCVDQSMNVWIRNWSQGDIGGGSMARLIDCAQMLVHLSLVATPARAVAAAARQIGTSELLATGLVLQSTVLPKDVRHLAKKTKVLDELRALLSEIAPSAEVPEPLKVERFSPRTAVMFTLATVAIFVVVGGLNFNAVLDALRQANPWWILAAVFTSALPWIGAAIPLIAFTPGKIRLWETTLVQVAAAIVNLVAPAGIGPAAVNMRFLKKKGVSTPSAVASVTLVQASQFLTSVFLLVLIVIGTGTSLNVGPPSTTTIWAAVLTVTAIGAVIAVPALRKLIWSKIQPFWEQAYPQLLWIFGHPKELSIAFFGNLLNNLGYIMTFGFILTAFGHPLPFLSLAITYLLSTTVGAVIPTPGGIGPVEAALTAGLQLAGVPGAFALPVVLVFRLLTFYGRLPLGWLALRHAEKKGWL